MEQTTNSAAQAMMERIHDLLSARGESVETMSEVSELLRELAADPQFRFDEGGDVTDMVVATIRNLVRGANGERLQVFDFKQPWPTPETASVHWHNYWQVLFLVRGNWQDTIWEPVAQLEQVGPESIRIARREVMHAGDVQILGPTEPHGWEAGEPRNADDALMLLWTGPDYGKPLTAIDLATGATFDEIRPAV
jgi:predicted metal-dependent enzyme (double-stranded beta helix superfamily)